MCNVLLGQIMRLRFLFSENTFLAKQRLFFFQKKVKATFLHRKCHSWSHCSPPPPQKRPKCHPHVNVSSSVGRLLYFGIPRLLRYSFFRMTDLHAANLRRFVASFKKIGGLTTWIEGSCWMNSKLNEYYSDDRKRESHCARVDPGPAWGACSRIPYFRSHPHLIISPKPRRKRLGRRKWPTELLYSTE